MMNLFKIAACGALTTMIASATFAQTMAPNTQAAPRQTAAKPGVPATTEFLTKAAAGNKFEIDSSRLALDKSKSEPVRTFATMMVKDHGEAATKMKQAVTEARVAAPPETLDARHRAELDQLSKTDGAAFDRAYVEAQLKGHEETVALFTAYAEGGENPRIRQFARELLPSLQMHLEQVRKLKV
jgi:putative membrane protein